MNYQVIFDKFKNSRGMTRAGLIAVIVVIVMLLVVLGVPFASFIIDRSYASGCMSARDTANDYLSIEYLGNTSMTLEEARTTVRRLMPFDDICPEDGNIYITEDHSQAMPYKVICGIHDTDLKEKTRYNAANALQLVTDAVNKAQEDGDQYPETVTIETNGRKLTAELIDERTILRSGTDYTSGVKGTVIYYSIVGHSDFGEDCGLEDGEIWYFSYADEDHCANYNVTDGWYGDSYTD